MEIVYPHDCGVDVHKSFILVRANLLNFLEQESTLNLVWLKLHRAVKDKEHPYYANIFNKVYKRRGRNEIILRLQENCNSYLS